MLHDVHANCLRISPGSLPFFRHMTISFDFLWAGTWVKCCSSVMGTSIASRSHNMPEAQKSLKYGKCLWMTFSERLVSKEMLRIVHLDFLPSSTFVITLLQKRDDAVSSSKGRYAENMLHHSLRQLLRDQQQPWSINSHCSYALQAFFH